MKHTPVWLARLNPNPAYPRSMSRLVLLALVGLLTLPFLASCDRDRIPAEYRGQIKQAARTCPDVSPQLLAAQIAQESGWDSTAVSPDGAEGLSQFMPETWTAWGTDADGDGQADPYSAEDAIKSQARLMCHLVEVARESDVPGDPIELALAAYNAGWSPVAKHEGIPPFTETTDYVAEIGDRAEKFRAEFSAKAR